jgi:beta-lactamase class A
MRGSVSRQELSDRIAAVRGRFSGDLGIAAKNLATGEEVMIDADRAFPTASTFKIPVMIEVFRQAHLGLLQLDDRLTLQANDLVKGSGVLRALSPGCALTIRDLVTLMIIVSDNTATNMLIYRVGGVEPVNQLMRGLGLDSILIRHRIDFSLIGDDNLALAEAAPRDLMRLCELIARDELISAEASRAMLAILRQQHYLNQFPRYLNYNPYGPELNEPQQIWIANKTGSLPGMRADSGIVSLPGDVRIAFCVMAEHSDDTGFTFENEAEIANGVLGRLLIEYWWPGDWEEDGIGRASPYLDASLTTRQPLAS